MLDKIFELVKGQVSQAVDSEPDIPQDKKEQTVDTATNSIIDSLKSYATPENISKITSLFNGGHSPESAVQQSGIAGGIQSSVISNLTTKAGLSSGVASKLAANIIPALISMFSNKVKDGNEPDFNIGSLVGAFTGGKSGSAGGIMDMVGGFLKK